MTHAYSPDDHDPHAEIESLEAINREREALDMRLSGMSYREIGLVQSCDPATAHDRVERGIAANVPRELQDQVRVIELERLGALYRRNILIMGSDCTTPAEKMRAEDMILKLHDRVVTLTGAAAPAEVHVYNHDAMDAEIIALMDTLTRPVAPAPTFDMPDEVHERVSPPPVHGRWTGRMHRPEGDDPDYDSDR